MGATPGGRPGVEQTETTGTPFPLFVDWLLGAFVALTGLGAMIGGGTLWLFVDRAAITDGVADGTITVTLGTRELSEAETVEVTEAVVTWSAIGLLVTGIALVLFAIAFVVARHRTHRRARPDEPASSYGTVALIGAVATTVLSFVAISPILGGALSGYIERARSGRSVSVGTLAGVLPALPMGILSLFVLGGLVVGLLAVGEAEWAIMISAATVLVVLLVIVVSAAMGAFGGYIGGRLAGRWGRGTREYDARE